MKVELEGSNLCVESLSGLAQNIVSGSVRNCIRYNVWKRTGSGRYPIRVGSRRGQCAFADFFVKSSCEKYALGTLVCSLVSDCCGAPASALRELQLVEFVQIGCVHTMSLFCPISYNLKHEEEASLIPWGIEIPPLYWAICSPDPGNWNSIGLSPALGQSGYPSHRGCLYPHIGHRLSEQPVHMEFKEPTQQ